MKFRKKPVVIEAVQWNGTNLGEIWIFVGTDINQTTDGKLEIVTLEGTMYASDGDWIIKGISGEFYPCKPEIFEATYERVEE